jgi:hypothetical protein
MNRGAGLPFLPGAALPHACGDEPKAETKKEKAEARRGETLAADLDGADLFAGIAQTGPRKTLKQARANRPNRNVGTPQTIPKTSLINTEKNLRITPGGASEFSSSLLPGEDRREKENTQPKHEAKEPVATVEPKATEVSRPSTPEEEEIILERSRRQGMADPCKAHLRYAVLGMRKEARNQCTL